MTFSPRSVSLSFAYLGEDYTMVFDFETIAAFEEATGSSVLALAATSAGAPPKLSTLGAMMHAALGRHHPDLTLVHAMQMVTDPAVQAVFGKGLASAMPQPADSGEAGAPGANPPQRGRGAKKRSAGKIG